MKRSSLPRGAERLFDFPRLYRAKFAITGAVLGVVRPLAFRTFVTALDVVRAAGIPAGARICEIGCGDGENYRTIAGVAGEVEYTGLDINPAMVAHCAQAHPNQRWLVATPPYEFGTGEFDYCVIINVLHHLNSRGEVLRMLAEARRIAKKIVLFEPLQSESRALAAIKNAYWTLTDGGSRYLRVGEFHALFARAGLELTWERFSAPVRQFYGAHLIAGPDRENSAQLGR